MERGDIPTDDVPGAGEFNDRRGPDIMGGGDGAHGDGGLYCIGDGGPPRCQPRGGWFGGPDIPHRLLFC